MTSLRSMQALLVFLTGLVFEDVLCSDYCVRDNSLEYCTWSCCGSGRDQYCCMSPYTIAGIVFGCIAAICTIAAVIFCFCQYKKQKSQVVHLPNAQRVFVINNGQGQQMQSSGYYTYPSGYGAAYPAQPNQYSKQVPAPPPYTPSSAPPPPPPAYSPPPNPFAKAAAQADATARQENT